MTTQRVAVYTGHVC